MSLYDLTDRISWQQACVVLGCSKNTFYRLVKEGKIPAYGADGRCRFYLKSDCVRYLENKKRRGRPRKGAN